MSSLIRGPSLVVRRGSERSANGGSLLYCWVNGFGIRAPAARPARIRSKHRNDVNRQSGRRDDERATGPNAGRRQRRRRPRRSPSSTAGRPGAGPVLARRLPLRHGRDQGRGARRASPRERGLAVTRFDYSGHGRSGGASRTAPSRAGSRRRCAVFDRTTRPPDRRRLVDGRLARAPPRRGAAASGGQDGRIAGLVLIAPGGRHDQAS